MSIEQWIERVAEIRQHSSQGRRAPHKPLLMLYALGRLERGGRSQVTFAEAEEPLQDLLLAYGPPGTGATPQYPFRRLENDGLWTVDLTTDSNDPGESVTGLREFASGRFPDEFEAALADPTLRAAVAGFILDTHFPPSLHPDLLAAVGLDVSPVIAGQVATSRPRRDPRFRENVLMAYEYRCSFCGYDGHLDRGAIGLEAAHVRWHAFDGPDSVDNGLSLCTMHHKLLDQGALGLTADHTITVSQRFVGRGAASERYVLALAGAEMVPPQPGHPHPADEHIEWHKDEVFRGPARLAVA